MPMNCLDKYRGRLIREINKELPVILERPEEEPVHDFRVAVKRLTALYYFLHAIDPGFKAKAALKPYRSIFKSIGYIRDGHIAAQLVADLDQIDLQDSKILVRALNTKIRKDHRSFQNNVRAQVRLPIRMPTVRSTGISESAILRRKPEILKDLLVQILNIESPMNAQKWHRKRILLKRYHHKLDAFYFCPGHKSDETEIKQIKVLEQLLGDWHDRVVTIQLLRSLPGLEARAAPAVKVMEKQGRLMLGAAKIYLHKFSCWHQELKT